MAGIYKIEIEESTETLKEVLREQKTGSGKERVQVLYLLKSQKAETIQEAAVIIGRNRVTVQEWLAKYRQGGLANLLLDKARTGRPRKVPQWAENALVKRLQENQGFESYGEIGQWLSEKLGIVINYKTLHQLVHYRLKAAPKVARPISAEQSGMKLEAFKKT